MSNRTSRAASSGESAATSLGSVRAVRGETRLCRGYAGGHTAGPAAYSRSAPIPIRMPLPSRIPRRSFVGWLGAIAAFVGLGARGRADAAPVSTTAPATTDTQGTPGFDAATLTALAEVVLPSELGADGARKAARDFTRYVISYRKGAELLHPYGSARIAFTGDSPAPKWRGQLEGLQRDARTRHKRAFSALPAAERRALVNAALANERADRMPNAMGANHVALALVAWYFGTPDATDLCYGVRIAKNQCRPLVNSPKEPAKLVRRAANSSGSAAAHSADAGAPFAAARDAGGAA